MSKVLIIEDEVAIADLEKDYLELSGFEVETENDGVVGLKRALSEDFDMSILDLMLPGVDGFEICRQIRGQKNTPIIMVSAKKDDIDKIRGLGLGADDYMTKPFSPSELVARVKAHLARYERLIGSVVEQNDVIEIRGLKIDRTARRVWVNGEERSFTTKEFDLLSFLAGHPNHVYSKEELFREIWDMPTVLPWYRRYSSSMLAYISDILKRLPVRLRRTRVTHLIHSTLRRSGESDTASRYKRS